MLKILCVLVAGGILSGCILTKSVTNKQEYAPAKVKVQKKKLKKNSKKKGYTYKVRGKRYSTIGNARGYRKKGSASWYGKPFHGRKTASGAIYNMYSMTAAHKRLPLSSKVRVTNLANNRSVILTVNDRGPFHGNRLIDVSYAAAKKLGFIHRGVARVQVTALP